MQEPWRGRLWLVAERYIRAAWEDDPNGTNTVRMETMQELRDALVRDYYAAKDYVKERDVL